MDISDDDSFDSYDQDEESIEEPDYGSEEEEHDQLPNVDEYKAQVGYTEKPEPSFWATFCCLTIFLIIVTVVTIVIVQSDESSLFPHKMDPYPFVHGETERYLKIKDYVTTVRGISHKDNFFEGSPTYLGAQWMAHGDPANYTVPSPPDLQFDERYSLAVLFFATEGEKSWHYNLNWMSGEHVCDWYQDFNTMDGEHILYGVSGCKSDEKGELYPLTINLRNVGLAGTIPEEVKGMFRLEALMLNSNKDLGGTFTEGLGLMTNLKTLMLQKASIRGPIPKLIGQMTALEYLGLGDNEFTGALPVELGQLTNLGVLGIDDNNFSSSNIIIFKPLFKNLAALYADRNFLTGTITSDWLGSFAKLRELDLSENLIDGSLPDTFFNEAEMLEVIDLNGNSISGPFPKNVQDNQKLEFLSLYDNQLTGILTDSLARLKQLKHLDIAQNSIQGTLPDAMQFMQLRYLFVGENKWDPGDMPGWLPELTDLRELSFKDCDLQGAIIDLQRLSNLQFLDLHENALTGTIPESLGLLGKLRHLLLKDNFLTGNLPPTFVGLSNLDVVLLEQNDLDGNAEALCTVDHDSKPSQIFVSDCSGNKFQCSCCTTCCSSQDEDCNKFDWNWRANLDPNWEYGYERARYTYDPSLDPNLEEDDDDDSGDGNPAPP